MWIHVISWVFMGFHGSSWAFMGLHGPSWAFMGLHGASWAFMGLHGLSWAFRGLQVISCDFWFFKKNIPKIFWSKKIWTGEFRFEFKNCKFCSHFFWEQIGPFSPEISKLKTGLSTSYFFERTSQSIVLNFKISSPEVSKLKTGQFTPYFFERTLQSVVLNF